MIFQPISRTRIPPNKKENLINFASIVCKVPSRRENHQPTNQPRPVKQESEPVRTKNELNNINNCEATNTDNSNVNSMKPPVETDDCKEPINMKSIWENSSGAATSADLMNSSDQGNFVAKITA
ncbi:hypothetical protein JTB14_031931 [Gonioctena quinquepunctata]|nr:hypothetical protein JTB14_031931 [Gonioctena quinquepunctata]